MSVEITNGSAAGAAADRAWTPGFGLPRHYYVSPQQYDADLERVFYGNWLFAGHTCQIPNAGDYLNFSIGVDSVLIVRDEGGAVRGFFNTCRHRGSRLCEGERGHVAKFVCPYHQWVYGLDGKLQQCRLMNDEVPKQDLPLHRASVEVVHGFIFVCLGREVPSFAPARETFERFFSPHRSAECQVCLELDFTINANWKTIVENNRECYHCATGHREFCLSNFDLGMAGDPRSSAEFTNAMQRMEAKWELLGLDAGPVNFPNSQWFRCMRFPLKEGFVTESLDGRPLGPIMGAFPDHDIGSLRVVGLPNMWWHLNSDHFMTTRLVPQAVDRTRATVTWYVHKDAVPGRDYDVDRVADVWRITGEQDWKLCEMNYAGQRSTRYVPSRLSQTLEQGVTHFHQWYLPQLARPRHADSADGSRGFESAEHPFESEEIDEPLYR